MSSPGMTEGQRATVRKLTEDLGHALELAGIAVDGSEPERAVRYIRSGLAHAGRELDVVRTGRRS